MEISLHYRPIWQLHFLFASCSTTQHFLYFHIFLPCQTTTKINQPVKFFSKFLLMVHVIFSNSHQLNLN